MRRICISFPSQKISAKSAKKRRRQRRRRRRQTPFARSFKRARRERIKRRKADHVQFNHLDDRRKRKRRRRRENDEQQQQQSRARVFVFSASGQRASKEEKYERFVITRLQCNTYIFSAYIYVLLKICAHVHVYVSVLRVNFQL